MQFFQMMQNGNPQAVLQNMVRQNPILKQAMPLVQNKNSQQLEQTFRNLCKQRGVQPEGIMKQFGMNLPN